jgi:hypothetical protein
MNFSQDVLFWILLVAVGVTIVVLAQIINAKIKRENIKLEENMDENIFVVRKTKASLLKGLGMIFWGVLMITIFMISRLGGNPTATVGIMIFLCMIFGSIALLGVFEALGYRYWKVDVNGKEIHYRNLLDDKTYTFDMITKAVVNEVSDSLGFGQVGKLNLTIHFGDKDRLSMHSTYIGYNVFSTRLKQEGIEIIPFVATKHKGKQK